MNSPYVPLRAIFEFALASTVACGGATAISAGDAGPDAGADDGPLAKCGSGCSPAQVVSECATFCSKFASLGCQASTPDPACPMHCETTTTMTAGCASTLIAFLNCAASVDPVCTAMGTVFVGCQTQEQAVNDCLNDAASSQPAPNPCVPDGVCPAIPRPTGTAACSGTGGGGPGGGHTANTMCPDRSGHTWQAGFTGRNLTGPYHRRESLAPTRP